MRCPWLCRLFPHRWTFIGNRDVEIYQDEPQRFGLYQCRRCEQLSVGAPQ